MPFPALARAAMTPDMQLRTWESLSTWGALGLADGTVAVVGCAGMFTCVVVQMAIDIQFDVLQRSEL